MATDGGYSVRKCCIGDCEQLLTLIEEEHARNETSSWLDVETLRKDGFGEQRLFHCVVAVKDKSTNADQHKGPSNQATRKGQLLGYALYLYYYLDNDGPHVFLEHLYVSNVTGKEGIEHRLLKEVAGEAARTPCVILSWTKSGGQTDSNVTLEPEGTMDKTLRFESNVFQMLEDQIKSIAAATREPADGIVIREARPEDCEQIIELMKCLAAHEKQPPGSIRLQADDLRRDGFGPNKLFYCNVAEDGGRLIGHTSYVTHYSARERVSFMLQDMFVSPEYRGRGVGSRLFQAVAKDAIRRGCGRVWWRALGWNKEAIMFYTLQGATNCTEQYDTHYMALTGDELRAFAGS